MSPSRPLLGRLLLAGLCTCAWVLPAEEYSLGFLHSITGAGSVDCVEDLEGVQLAVDEINAAGGLLNRHPIRLTIRDDKGRPDVAATQAKALIAEARPHAVIGTYSSGCALAAKPFFHEAKVLYILEHSNSEDITRLNPSPYVYSVVPNTYMIAKALAVSLVRIAQEKGWRRYATLCADYPFGRSIQSNIVSHLKALMPELEVTETRWPKVGEPEWASHMAALAKAKPDFVFNGLTGDDLKLFNAAAERVRFFDRFPCPGAGVSVNTLQDKKENQPLGALAYSRGVFAGHLHEPVMQHLIRLYQAKRPGRYPSDWVMLNYDAVMTLKQGVDKANSIDTEAVKDALKGMTISTCRGSLTFRAIDNQLDCPVYLGVIGLDPAYPFPMYTNLQVLAGGDLMRPVAEVIEARRAAP